MNPIAIKSDTLSRLNDTRYILIDEDTGELLDDAQGYGYRSEQKAYAGWTYTSASKERQSEMKAYAKQTKQTKKNVRAFCESHKDFVEAAKQYLYAHPDKKLNASIVQRAAEKRGINFSHYGFTAKDFVKYW